MQSAKYKTTQEISTGYFQQKHKNKIEILTGRLAQQAELSAPYEILLRC